MTDTSSNKDQMKREAKKASEDIADKARKTASDASEALRDEASSRAESAKQGVAGEVSDVASALRKAADDMRDGSPQERTFGQIASSLADVSDSIRDKDMGQMANEITEFAKRNPMLFLGGVALAGFAATRFAMASSKGSAQTTGRSDYASRSSYTGAGSTGGAPMRTGASAQPRPAGVAPTESYNEGGSK